ncbi:MAG: diaminopimelate epimerase [Gemmatimonadales bacterium]
MNSQAFYKMTGSGNDFVMLDGRSTSAADWPAERIRAVCDRRIGVGADGLVILTPGPDNRVRMDFWNCDGSRASMCGNAALCSTRLSARLGLTPTDGMHLVTGAGTFPSRCLPGPPAERAELQLPDFTLPETVRSILLGPGESNALLATVGVPHLVLLVENLERPDLMARGRELRSDPALGPQGANTNFVGQRTPAQGGGWGLRTYERGVEGETLACGTGAVAAAVALAQLGQVTLPMNLVCRSGRILHITATLSAGKATNVLLAGEGILVFTGVL